MIVTRDNFDDCLLRLEAADVLACDTETTGLRPYHGHELFSIILCSLEQVYYLNFNQYENIGEDSPEYLLPEHVEKLKPLFAKPDRRWLMHNAKFDLAMLENFGIRVGEDVHDTMAIARLIDSTLFPNQFSLDHLAAQLGYKKMDTVKTWLQSAHGGVTVQKTEGKKQTKKDFHYQLAPWDLIVPYGERDGEITFALGEWQRAQIFRIKTGAEAANKKPLSQVYLNEVLLTRTVYEMERHGVLIDRDFCRAAIVFAHDRMKKATTTFHELAGEPYLDSAVVFKRVFASDKESWTYGDRTATGQVNPSFDSDALAGFKNPLAKEVLAYRKAKSDLNYFQGFLYEADAKGYIHASFNQHGAATGRFSSSNPNLQNLTKDDEEALADEFVVRRAIVPEPGMVFHMIDYQAMEYRLMLDQAAHYSAKGDTDGILPLIAKIRGGLDVHQAMADAAGITRPQAKMINFATLYGSGIANLALKLGVPLETARRIRQAVFNAAPEVAAFIRITTANAERDLAVTNWFGRRCRLPDAEFAYKATNYIIQGGCADVVKLAMNRVHARLQRTRTKLVLSIHDELVLCGPADEARVIIPEVKQIMETVYPWRFLPLTCSVDHSFKSLADKIKGICP